MFDNYQSVPEANDFHRLIAIAVEEVPAHGKLMVLSRFPPPPAMARLLANEQVCAVGADELRLTETEALDIVRIRGNGEIDDCTARACVERSKGWVAGLSLLIHDYQSGLQPADGIPEAEPQVIFDYFANEVFSKIDPDIQSFLLKSAFLPQMNHDLVERLTDHRDGSRILSELTRKNFFTTQHAGTPVVYQYHPLFRHFLLNRARAHLRSDAVNDLKQQAALILIEVNQIEQGVHYLIELGAWEQLLSTVNDIGRALLSRGRSKTLLGWIERIPEDVMASQPWLLFWKGASLQTVDMHAARAALESAYRAFKRANDVPGQYLAGAEIVLTHWYERRDFRPMNQWLEEFRTLLRHHAAIGPPPVEARVCIAMFILLFTRGADPAEAAPWDEKMLALVNGDLTLPQRVEIGALIVLKCFCLGHEYSHALAVVNALSPLAKKRTEIPLVDALWTLSSWNFDYLYSGDETGLLDRCAYALEVGDQTAMHALDFALLAGPAYVYLTAGRCDSATASIERLAGAFDPAGGIDKAHYHFFLAWWHWLKGRPSDAREEALRCLRTLDECGSRCFVPFPLVLLAQIHVGQTGYRQAFLLCAQIRRLPMSSRNHFGRFMAWLTDAQCAQQRGQIRRCRAFLERALRLGRQQHIVRFPCFKPETVADLCAQALRAGIEVDYVQDLIRQRRLPPPVSADVPDWPWPLRIYCFGPCRLVKDDKVIEFRRKAPKKALQLLKLIVSQGKGPISEEKILDTLWPAEPGDAACTAFSSMLNRLRKLVGREAITLSDGKISLNPEQCWVDIRVFETLLDRADQTARSGDADLSASLIEQALELYGEGYLAGDADYPWALSARERLRNRYLRYAGILAKHWCDHEEYEKAIDCYEKGLQTDPLAEAFYQDLIRCYHRIGSKSDAVNTYHRCKKMLAVSLGNKPAAATESLYRSLLS